jgi:hypothetical protein
MPFGTRFIAGTLASIIRNALYKSHQKREIVILIKNEANSEKPNE